MKSRNTLWRRGSLAGFLAVAALSQTSCTVGPDYKPPQSKVSPAYLGTATQPSSGITTQPSTRPSSVSADAAPLAEWWTTLRDPELDKLIQRSLQGNLSLQRTAERIYQSRSNLKLVGAGLYPTVKYGGTYAYVNTGNNGGFGSLTGSSNNNSSSGGNNQPAGINSSLWQQGLDATWEIDVFGGQRRQIEAAADDLDAAVEDRRSAMVSLIAEVAHDYLELRGLQERLAIAQENLHLQQDTLDLTLSLRQAGFSSELDVSRAQTQVSQTRASIVPLRTQITQTEYAIDTLLGLTPGALATELEKKTPVPPVPSVVSIGVPSSLLRRRPDIRSAERAIAAANARIGQYVADYYPKFSVSGYFGSDATTLQHVFDWESHYFLVDPGFSWTILDFNRTAANIEMQKALYRQAMLSYEDTVLTALREVDDALVAYGNEQDHHAALADAVVSARAAVDISRDQYKQGLIDFLQVLDAQRQLLSAQDDLAQSDQSVSTNLVALYKALGGGWEVETVHELTNSGPASVQPVGIDSVQ
jgi:NodT family efflux transporter outer membrane factor (OMF) lipoprotein